MDVYTAQYRYSGPDRMDITVKGKDPIGYAFAPTWDMVKAFKKYGNEQVYITAYHAMMVKLMQEEKWRWEELMKRDRIVLVCFCPANTFCHRHLLANYLWQLGANSKGEITTW